MRLHLLLISGAFVAMQAVSVAQHGSLLHRPPSPKEAEVGS